MARSLLGWYLAGCLAVALLAACDGGEHSSARQSGTTAKAPAVQLTMSTPRAVHHATKLADGEVLITGGCTSRGCGGFERAAISEIYDPATRRFRPGPRMHSPRASNTATLLPDGRVLLVGGYPGEGEPPQPTAEVYEPTRHTFVAVGSMSTGRADHTATLMPDARVLIAGGTDGSTTLASTELFDPVTNRFFPGPRLTSPRQAHSAVISDGHLVLIGGSADGHQAIGTTDVLRGGHWVVGPRLVQPRIKHAAMALADGSILVIGGASSTDGRHKLDTTELIDLHELRGRPGPRLSEGEYKLDGAVVRLRDGRIFIAGGRRIDVFDPHAQTMTVAPGPPVPRRSFLTVTAVGRGTVLVAGGYDDAITPSDSARLINL